MGRSIWKEAIGVVSSRWKLLSILNLVFFVVAFGVSVLVGLYFPSPFLPGQRVYVLPNFLYSSLPLLVLFIFCFNLAIAAFAVITLPGFLFFPLSFALLVVRAVLWGFVLYPLPIWPFLAALPTLLLEGEGYVLAAFVGTAVGYSWLRRADGLSRGEAFAQAIRKYMNAYIFVILMLAGAAIVESATIMLLQM